MPVYKVLVVDDEPTYRASVSRILTNDSYNVTAAASAEDALDIISKTRFDLLISDLKMPGMSGLDLLEKVNDIAPGTASIIMTAYGTIDSAIEATKKGAFHYLVKPFNIDDVVHLAKKAIAHKKLKEENTILKSQLQRTSNISNIIGKSDKMLKIFETIEKVSENDTTVLICGETGSGKDVVAKAIHYMSLRSSKLFVNINCSSSSSEQLESEMFGHLKGSFTGAVTTRQGKIELANDGTVYFDEIAELPLSTQAKVLRVLEEKRFEPLGSDKTCEVDIRIIASTSKNLETLVKEGRFREDLYYKLNIVPINIPPLRQRQEDLPLLISNFLGKFNKKTNKKVEGFSEEVLTYLNKYQWPGNVRELENLVERLVTLNDGIIEKDDLPVKYIEDAKPAVSIDNLNFINSPKINIPEDGIDLNKLVRGLEDSLIMQALDKTKWNKNQAAKLLRLNRTTLVEKLRKKGLIKTRI